MKRDEILPLIAGHKRELNELGARSVSLFGSIARDQGRADSDVDILVEFSRPVGLFEFARVKLFLEGLLHCEVDLVTPQALRKELKDGILREAIRAA